MSWYSSQRNELITKIHGFSYSLWTNVVACVFKWSFALCCSWATATIFTGLKAKMAELIIQFRWVQSRSTCKAEMKPQKIKHEGLKVSSSGFRFHHDLNSKHVNLAGHDWLDDKWHPIMEHFSRSLRYYWLLYLHFYILLFCVQYGGIRVVQHSDVCIVLCVRVSLRLSGGLIICVQI